MFAIEEKDPMAAFMYGLRAPDTKRQYPRRFQYFLDFLKIPGILEEQARQFILKARENPQWAQESLMSFIDFQKERVRRGEISDSTITNYYKATKLFCIMNDLASAKGLAFTLGQRSSIYLKNIIGRIQNEVL
jgi:hypothetical protein